MMMSSSVTVGHVCVCVLVCLCNSLTEPTGRVTGLLRFKTVVLELYKRVQGGGFDFDHARWPSFFKLKRARVWESLEAQKAARTITHDMTKKSGCRIAGDHHLVSLGQARPAVDAGRR